MITKPGMFEHASHYEGQLTERQREVLRLIAQGMTNGQIAERLDITLAGAKWHVAEILSKLGLESREDAAAFYRWRSSGGNRVRSLFRGLVGTGLGKAALGTAAAGAVAAGAVWFWPGGNGDVSASEEAGQPFYLEATTTDEQNGIVTEAKMRWWFQDGRRGRIERDTPKVVKGDASFGEPGTSLVVRDGKDQYHGGKLFFRQSLDEFPLTEADGAWAAPVGPMKQETIAQWRAEFFPEAQERLSRDHVQGRDVVVVEKTLCGANCYVGRAWIDEDRMFVMRFEFEIDGFRSRSDVTKLDYGTAPAPERYTWTPAPDAVESQCRTNVQDMGNGIVPPPFLGVPQGAVPPGMMILPNGSATDPATGLCMNLGLKLGLPDAEPKLSIHQELHDPIAMLPQVVDEELPLSGGLSGQFRTSDDGMRTLAWVHYGLGVSLRSSALSKEELVAFANALLGE